MHQSISLGMPGHPLVPQKEPGVKDQRDIEKTKGVSNTSQLPIRHQSCPLFCLLRFPKTKVIYILQLINVKAPPHKGYTLQQGWVSQHC